MALICHNSATWRFGRSLSYGGRVKRTWMVSQRSLSSFKTWLKLVFYIVNSPYHAILVQLTNTINLSTVWFTQVSVTSCFPPFPVSLTQISVAINVVLNVLWPPLGSVKSVECRKQTNEIMEWRFLFPVLPFLFTFIEVLLSGTTWTVRTAFRCLVPKLIGAWIWIPVKGYLMPASDQVVMVKLLLQCHPWQTWFTIWAGLVWTLLPKEEFSHMVIQEHSPE